MCDKGNEIMVDLGDVGVGVDACIAGFVASLNKAGIDTLASCCGHGTHYGSVALADGRWLLLMSDTEFRYMDTSKPVHLEQMAADSGLTL